ncbi:MAG: YhcH/YjgK/YiaL family protein [Eubacteriales bacterium]|nr:YhcH/YjgK/YiaL family protein [Eubacteriales bacterium]
MIYDKIENIETYYGLSERLSTALHALHDADFSVLEDGRHIIDGDKIFMNLSTYETKPSNEHPEAHKKYIDIQYSISGEELIGVAPLDEMTGIYSSDPEKDLFLYNGSSTPLKLGKGTFIILFPQDAHAPSVACGAPSTIRKAVIKVLV